MSAWTDNLIQYTVYGRVVNCPDCGSDTVSVQEIVTNRRSLIFHCNHCGADHLFDGAVNRPDAHPVAFDSQEVKTDL